MKEQTQVNCIISGFKDLFGIAGICSAGPDLSLSLPQPLQ